MVSSILALSVPEEGVHLSWGPLGCLLETVCQIASWPGLPHRSMQCLGDVAMDMLRNMSIPLQLLAQNAELLVVLRQSAIDSACHELVRAAKPIHR